MQTRSGKTVIFKIVMAIILSFFLKSAILKQRKLIYAFIDSYVRLHTL